MIISSGGTDPRITGIRLSWDTDRHRKLGRDEARVGLVAAMRPFGSLVDCALPLEAIADLAIAYCDGPGAATAAALIAAVRNTTADARCAIGLGDWWVSLTTPTSGAVIRLATASPYGYSLTVDFGPLGSTARNDQIADATPGHLRWLDIDDGVTPLPTEVAKAHLRYAYEIAARSGAVDPSEPAPGWVARTVERARREGVLPPR